jgi:IS5 family transposase
MVVFRSNSSLKETAMAFKEYDKRPTFLDMEIQRAVTHSRNQQVLSEIDAVINWDPIEKIVQENYPVGQSDFGNKAYPPLMLLKAILIQKWFGIKSDPDLECQINDRFSFKTFIGLPFSEPSPDHSIICRFRERTGKETLEKVHHELLNQFDTLGFSIESGMALDARVVKSASRPVSDKKLRELREKRKSRLQMKKKTQRAMRFQRDLDSDWTVKNGKPVFGMKEHASIDVESGLVLSTCVSRASEHDTNYFQYTVVKGIHGKKLPEKVYADKGYCSETNRQFLKLNGIDDGIMRKNQVNASLTETEVQRNKLISKIRYKIEQYFGLTHKYHGAGKARFTTIVKENWDHLCGAMAFNIKRVALTLRKQEMMIAAT